MVWVCFGYTEYAISSGGAHAVEEKLGQRACNVTNITDSEKYATNYVLNLTYYMINTTDQVTNILIM